MNVPSAVTKACSLDARVVRCVPICRQHVEIELSLRDFPPSQPGQFVQVLCRPTIATEDKTTDWPIDGFPSLSDFDSLTPQAYLRRPFSIADSFQASDASAHLCIISRNVGAGTAWLEALKPGDSLNVAGPLGRGFRIPPNAGPVVLAGGGVGIPPLLYLIRRLHESARHDVVAIFGATTRDLLPLRLSQEPANDGTPRPCAVYPASTNCPTIITSDDGSIGLPGRVTDGLCRWHERHRDRAKRPLVLACGPDGMLRAIAQWTNASAIDCQLCIERSMGCGVGTCLSCVVRLHDATRQSGWRWALACTDGPVFDRDQLVDYGPDPGA